MAVSFDIVQLTDSYAKIKLGDLPTERTLYIDAILWESNSGSLITHDQYETYLYSNDYYFINFNGLAEQTWYDCRFTICYNNYYDDGGSLVSGGWIDDSFQTTSYSPGGSQKFSLSSTNNSITVTVTDLYNYDEVVYSLYNSSMTRIDRDYSGSLSYTFTGLSPLTTYYVSVFYRENGYPEIIYSINGNEYQSIITQSGGGGNWSYRNVSPISISSSTVSWATGYALIGQEGLLFTFNSTQNGTLDIFSTYPSGGPLKSYIGNVDNSYDPSNGIPYSYNDYDTGSFSYSINVINAGTYYLWVTSANDSAFTLNLNFVATPPVVVTPSFSCAASGNSITFTVTNTQDYPYLRYYVRLNNTQIHDSESTYGRFITTNPYTISNLSYSTTYTVNVQYANVANPNLTTERAWVYTSNPPTVTTGAAPQPTTGYVYIYTNSGWKKAKPYIFDGSQWKPASPYIFNGSQWKPTIE